MLTKEDVKQYEQENESLKKRVAELERVLEENKKKLTPKGEIIQLNFPEEISEEIRKQAKEENLSERDYIAKILKQALERVSPFISAFSTKDTCEVSKARWELYNYLEENNMFTRVSSLMQDAKFIPYEDSLLEVILDETHDCHAPDLKYAIDLWLDLYHLSPRKYGEHKSNADNWLETNTPYINLKAGQTSMNRIRDITSPLKKWSPHRAKI